MSGSANGGSASSGSSGSTGANGGSSSGGNASAGNASGGNANGGNANGGNANGGNASGGKTATGGASGGDASHACATVDDCVIANVFSNKGCCARTDCGGGYNKDWVANEPCASADESKDPVPASCSMGCLLCPASSCPMPVGVICKTGSCAAVTQNGPCVSDADCETAVDFTTVEGACCNCPSVASTAYDDAQACVVKDPAAAKPAGCAITGGGMCQGFTCPAKCASLTPTCTMGRCFAK